jgi:hypothetical protein
VEHDAGIFASFLQRRYLERMSERIWAEKRCGLTRGFWDIVFKTRYPASLREALDRGERLQPSIKSRVENSRGYAA